MAKFHHGINGGFSNSIILFQRGGRLDVKCVVRREREEIQAVPTLPSQTVGCEASTHTRDLQLVQRQVAI